MKTVILAAAFAALGATGALAADLPSFVAPAFAPVGVPSWTGPYAGLNAGVGIDDSHLRLYPVESSFQGGLLNDDARFLSRRVMPREINFTGGGQVGYNYQFGAGSGVVVGAEADFNYLGLTSTKAGVANVPASFNGGLVGFVQGFNGGQALNYGVATKSSIDWFGTLRGRLGYAFGNFMAYGTGGLAYGDVTNTGLAFFTPGNYFGPFPFAYGNRANDIRLGWTAGGGIEYALTSHLSLRGEYLYTDLGSKTLGLPAAGGNDALVPGSFYALRDDARFQTVRAGLNYKW